MYIDKEKSDINPKNIPFYWLANQGVGGKTDEACDYLNWKRFDWGLYTRQSHFERLLGCLLFSFAHPARLPRSYSWLALFTGLLTHFDDSLVGQLIYREKLNTKCEPHLQP